MPLLSVQNYSYSSLTFAIFKLKSGKSQEISKNRRGQLSNKTVGV